MLVEEQITERKLRARKEKFEIEAPYQGISEIMRFYRRPARGSTEWHCAAWDYSTITAPVPTMPRTRWVPVSISKRSSCTFAIVMERKWSEPGTSAHIQ